MIDRAICKLVGRLDASNWRIDSPYHPWIDMIKIMSKQPKSLWELRDA